MRTCTVLKHHTLSPKEADDGRRRAGNGGTVLWPHTPSRTKPTLNIDHRGPVDDTTVGVGRLTASMASIIVQLLMEVITLLLILRRVVTLLTGT